MKNPFSIKRTVWVLASVCLVIALGVWWFAPALVRNTVEGEGFRAMLSREVSKSMKVDGEFAPLTMDGWTVSTDSYHSTGWPGEAIGGLEARGVRGRFDVLGVLRRV